MTAPVGWIHEIKHDGLLPHRRGRSVRLVWLAVAALSCAFIGCAVAFLFGGPTGGPLTAIARSQERKGAPPSFCRYVTMPELLVPVKRLAPMSMNPKRSDILWSRPCGFDVAWDSLLNYEVLRLAEFVF